MDKSRDAKKGGMKKLPAILIVLCVVFWALPVYAATPLIQPESVTIPDGGKTVFRNLAEIGDVLVVFESIIAIPSDNYSETPARDSVMFELYADNGTLLCQGEPYVFPFFPSNGYGAQVSGFYFSAADNGTAPVWGTEAIIKIGGSPTYYSPAWTYSFPISASDYSSSSNSTTNRNYLYNYILLLTDRLTSLYSGNGVVLKTTSDSGIVLSSYGELYFRGAIPSIQALCPSLFFIQVYVPERMAVGPYDMSKGTEYGNRLAGWEFEEGFDNLGNAIGINGEFAAALIMIAITFALCIFCLKSHWGLELGLTGGMLITIFFALIIGNAIFALTMVLSLLGIIGLVWLFVLRRA